ncbi:MAG: 3-keto-5-aminohexanoate cleavage protein, partial [Litoricolaceae bacterium]|nr:3-keto-5-aminohexanoate cleavage protein [Litorivicinaceae bacterium]
MTFIMVAPNGARRTTLDHPAVPVNDQDLVETAVVCFEAGARGIHAHIRTSDQLHLLDVERYEALIAQLHCRVPGLSVQVTSEAAGIYESDAQIDLLARIQAPWVSVAIREILRAQETSALTTFFAQLLTKTRVQFILYDTDDLKTLTSLVDQGIIHTTSLEVLYVLGRYSKDQESTPDQLDPFIEARDAQPKELRPMREMICAFGRGQISCLLRAASEGMDLRIGFENGIWLPDGTIASDNADLVRT